MKRMIGCAVMALAAAGCVESAGDYSKLTSGKGETPLRKEFHGWAERPVMGWNSWDCWGTQVTEEQALANAEYMEKHLKRYGWELVTIDIQWYEPQARGLGYRQNARLEMDENGRLRPAGNRFPSTRETRGFKPIADAIHAKGLKFGVHLMRGIPRQAVRENVPILGTSVRAQDIANTNSTCPWNPDMYGVDMSKPGAQEYYDSVFALLASWEIDFVKVDDLSRPYHQPEVEAIRKAIDKTGRKIVFSTSPGATPLSAGPHVQDHANQWRISDDFWDTWPLLKEQFERVHSWTPFRGPGHFPDADMLPLGNIRAFENNGWTRLTKDEQYTLMNLWSIVRSPLIMGGHMPKNDEFTLSLLTNEEVIAVNQRSRNNRQLVNENDLVAWAADAEGGGAWDRYVALFNARDAAFIDEKKAVFASGKVSRERQSAEVAVDLAGARTLWLVVDDGGDNYNFDHANWVNPRVVVNGQERKLTEMQWRRATAGYEQARLNRTMRNQPMSVGGRTVEGIGTHANSTITYDLPEGATRFLATAALDDSGVRGNGATVRFYVFTQDPAPAALKPEVVRVPLSELGIGGAARVKNLWTKEEKRVTGEVSAELAPHASVLLRVRGE